MEDIVKIALGLIDPNPWQPREAEDYEHVKHLAESIAVDGLLQIPTARRVGERVQLAFGHSRLAAFHVLYANGRAEFGAMPLNIVTLDDEAMFRYAIKENVDRRDLSVIERARAMVVYRDQFGKTSQEIGALFGVADSTVRGTIRLLKLPEHLRQAAHRGEMSEGSARALVTMYDQLSAAEIERAENRPDEELKPSVVVEAALSGARGEAIDGLVKRLIERVRRGPESDEPAQPETPPWAAPESAREAAQVWQPQGERTAPAPAPMTTTAAPARPQASQTAPADLVRPQTTTAAYAPPPAPAEPEPAPARPLTWSESTIMINMTFWAEDGHPSGRMVIYGVRVGDGAPVMRMARESDLVLPGQIGGLIEEIKSNFGGEQ